MKNLILDNTENDYVLSLQIGESELNNILHVKCTGWKWNSTMMGLLDLEDVRFFQSVKQNMTKINNFIF